MGGNFTLFFYFLKKEILVRYAGSSLGLIWSVVSPMVQIGLYWFVFSWIMKARAFLTADIPYIYFLLSTFFCWLAFADGLQNAANSIVNNGEIIKKVSFDNIILPVTAVSSQFILHMIGFCLFLAFWFIKGPGPSMSCIFIPIVIFLQFLFTIGISLVFASMIPFVRDLQHVLNYLIQILFFATPILYSMELVPAEYRDVFICNPLVLYIDAYHQIILLGSPLSMLDIMSMSLSSVVSLSIGIFCFNRLKDGFSDVL